MMIFKPVLVSGKGILTCLNDTEHKKFKLKTIHIIAQLNFLFIEFTPLVPCMFSYEISSKFTHLGVRLIQVAC